VVVPAALFDLDDTLLDYSGAAGRCWGEACIAVGGPAGLDVAALTLAVEVARAWFWSDPDRHARERVRMLDAWGKIAATALDAIGASSPVLAAAIATDFATRRHTAMQLFPDAYPCLARLRAHGVALGLVTNGDAGMQRDKIARFDLARLFDVIVIEGEFGVGKPDPRVYRHALAALATPPSAAWMVGDNLEWDVTAPQRLGLRGVWIDRNGDGLPMGHGIRPDRIVRSLAELEIV
jgi:putative hydrolase of the HAD superfamily